MRLGGSGREEWGGGRPLQELGLRSRVRQAGHGGGGDGAEEDSERWECPLQMPSLYDLHHITYIYGVPMVYLNARECQ